jgi:alkylated DNA nucleotide flippase Atl1
VDDASVERVRAAVRAIPPGQVRSYGEVAEEVGLRSARLVGRVLAEDGHDLPWHRVVRADGSFAPHIAAEQAARLRVEGVLAADGHLPPEHRPRARASRRV